MFAEMLVLRKKRTKQLVSRPIGSNPFTNKLSLARLYPSESTAKRGITSMRGYNNLEMVPVYISDGEIMVPCKDMSKMPDDTPCLLKVEGQWIEGTRYTEDTDEPYYRVAVLDVHGCGCCGGGLSTPTAWMPLPK